ncbi:UNVERIFIED_CONTAM: 2-phospho-L-lactate guanylyltransferase [Williamsia faeni]
MMDLMETRPVAVVIAVKELSAAKTRLAPALDRDARRALVLAMLEDTLTAVAGTGLERVVVVSPDQAVATTAGAFGADTVVDQGDVLNRAFAMGIDHALTRWPGSRILVLQADLPAATPASLTAAVEESAPLPSSYIPDHAGTGTTALFLDLKGPHAADFLRFGADSAKRHSDHGAVDLTSDSDRWPDLRIDVDTVDDLLTAARFGLGPSTSAILSRLRLSEQTQTPDSTLGPDGP